MSILDETKGGHFVIAIDELIAFRNANPSKENTIIQAMRYLSNAGKQGVSGVFVKDTAECFPFVLMMLMIGELEDKKTETTKKQEEPTASDLSNLEKEFSTMMDNMRSKK